MSKKKFKMRNSLKAIDVNEVREYIEENKEAKISFGCDSTKFVKNGESHARYVTAIIVFEPNKNRIFGEVTYERDFDNNPSRPQMRMMSETYKVSAIVTELAETLKNRDYSIHLDINSDMMFGSSVALQQAIGYIQGVHGVVPIVKNDPTGQHPWASSCVADYLLKR